MTDYKVGQDVLVESGDIFDGEAFIAPIAEEESASENTVYVDLQDRGIGGALALVSTESVVTLTEVFDAIKN